MNKNSGTIINTFFFNHEMLYPYFFNESSKHEQEENPEVPIVNTDWGIRRDPAKCEQPENVIIAIAVNPFPIVSDPVIP